MTSSDIEWYGQFHSHTALLLPEFTSNSAQKLSLIEPSQEIKRLGIKCGKCVGDGVRFPHDLWSFMYSQSCDSLPTLILVRHILIAIMWCDRRLAVLLVWGERTAGGSGSGCMFRVTFSAFWVFFWMVQAFGEAPSSVEVRAVMWISFLSLFYRSGSPRYFLLADTESSVRGRRSRKD